MLPIVPIHRRYLRTCRNCGTTWEVPRAVAGGGIARLAVTNGARRNGRAATDMGISGANVAHQFAAQQADSSASLDAFNEAMRQCNRCGLDDFDQEPLRRNSQPPGTSQPPVG